MLTEAYYNQDIYCASRSLYGLARDGQALWIFARACKNGNPISAVAFTSIFISLGYINASKSLSTVFSYLVSLVTIFAVLNWVAILTAHIHFRQALKAQGIITTDLPYVGVLQPYGSYFPLFISLLVIIFNSKKSRAIYTVWLLLTIGWAFYAMTRLFPILKLMCLFLSIWDRLYLCSMLPFGRYLSGQLFGLQ